MLHVLCREAVHACYHTGAGAELYRYTGTGPVELVYDLNPGTNTRVLGNEDWPMVELGGKLYFSGNNGTTGSELMMYNGTDAPALAGSEIYGGANGSNPDYLTVLGSRLYFEAEDVANGQELWMYDPATATNTRVTDLMPGPDDSNPDELIAWNNKLYFAARSPAEGYELRCYAGNNEIILPMLGLPAGQYFYHTTDDAGRLLVSRNVIRQ